MCEKRTRRVKKGSLKVRQREARRIQRLQRLSTSSSSTDDSRPSSVPLTVEKQAQNRAILELAIRTVALVQRNKIIQEKITELRQETSRFVATVMSNPENRNRYLEHIRLYGDQVTRAQQELKRQSQDIMSLKWQPIHLKT